MFYYVWVKVSTIRSIYKNIAVKTDYGRFNNYTWAFMCIDTTPKGCKCCLNHLQKENRTSVPWHLDLGKVFEITYDRTIKASLISINKISTKLYVPIQLATAENIAS